MRQENIGFIGLGIMGMPMARNLLKAGYHVVVYNRTRSKAEELSKAGAVPVGSPQEVAQQCNVVIIMVTDTIDVEEVILGSEGVIHGVRSDTVVIDMSTISPSATRRMAARLEKKGVHMLDAPVSGGQWGAVEGRLAIMVGGQESVFDRCLPVLQALGKHITLVGPSGAGQIVKLVNQILVAGTCCAVAEALVFAAAHGADLKKTVEAVEGGAAGSWQLSNLGLRMIKGDFAPGFRVRLQQKDLRLILGAARERSVSLPQTNLVHQLYMDLEADGMGEEGTQVLVKAIEKLAGVQAQVRA